MPDVRPRRSRLTFRSRCRALVRRASRSALPAIVATAIASIHAAPRHAWAQATSAGANADGAASAGQHFDRGVSLYKEGDFRAALAEFRRAYELSPNFAVLYNIAQAELELGEYARALDALERYVRGADDAGTKLSPARRKQVDEQLAMLQSRVGMLVVRVDLAGAEVLVDDVSVGRSPIGAPLRVTSGQRRVTVSRAGNAPLTKAVEIAGGETREVSFELGQDADRSAEATEGEPNRERETPRAEAAPKSRVPVYAAWGATGALAIGTVIAGALTLSAKGALDDERNRAGATRESLDDAQSRVRTTALVTDVFGVATVAAAGIAVYLTLSSTKPSGAKAAGGSVRVGVKPGGFSLDATF